MFDLLPKIPGLTYVGRLDYLTEGVLLFTTDGVGANALTHPSGEIERTYIATVRGDAAPRLFAARASAYSSRMASSIPNDINATSIGKGHWELEITIAEGKNHEVRRFCQALGLFRAAARSRALRPRQARLAPQRRDASALQSRARDHHRAHRLCALAIHSIDDKMQVRARPRAPQSSADTLMVQAMLEQVARRVVGQDYMVERLLIGLLTGGHVLLEGVPGSRRRSR